MADVGEKSFIAGLLGMLNPSIAFVNGFGDDASAIRIPGHSDLLFFKIDRAAKPMAARNAWVDYRMWGRLAVTANCSDILSCGAMPAAVMMAMILPRDWPIDSAHQIVLGCVEECELNNVSFVGGDTKEGTAAEVIGAAIGLGPPESLLTRQGAKPGDVIVVAGRLGGFLGAYLQLLDDRKNEVRPTAESDDWLDYVSHPRACWSEAATMREINIASAAMDTSDGLYDAISTLVSGHGADLDLTTLPHHEIAISCAERYGIPLINLAFGVGDWNIVYIVDAARWHDVALKLKASQVLLTAIGSVSDQPGLRWHDGSGDVFRSRPVVNQHFAARLEDESTLLERLRHEKLMTPLDHTDADR
jgi:thiamine-monophosphate kinase